MRIAGFSGSSMTRAAVLQSNKFREASMAKAHKKVQARRKSASRKPAGSKATARRPAKAKTKARTKPRPKHKFTVSHHREQDFDQACAVTPNTAISGSRRRPAAWCKP